MDTIAPDTLAVFSIYVITPNGDRWEVDGYNLYRYSRVKSIASNLREVLAREWPLPSDPTPLREMWQSLFEFGVDPSACTVDVVRKSDDAGENAKNGWKTVN